MSLETETKKIANNLQQLTDAIVTLTAALQCGTNAKSRGVDPGNQIRYVEETTYGEHPSLETSNELIPSDRVIPESIIGTTANMIVPDETVTQQDNTVVDISTAAQTQGKLMTMEEANSSLQSIVQVMGDGGTAVRGLLQQHNAISLAQIPAENYAAFVQEARTLMGAT